MDRKTTLTIGAGVVGLIILILLLRSRSPTVIQEGADKTPNYFNYNIPTIPYQRTEPISYAPPTPAGSQTATASKKCMCDSGCGDNGEYAGALRSILDTFWESTAALTNAYQSAIFNTLPASMKQYINQDKGYIESRRALAAIGTTFGIGGNAPIDLVPGHMTILPVSGGSK